MLMKKEFINGDTWCSGSLNCVTVAHPSTSPTDNNTQQTFSNTFSPFIHFIRK